MDELDKGIILDFKIDGEIQFYGLNFLDKLTKTVDIQCCVYSLSQNKSTLLPLKNIQENNESGGKSVFLKRICNECTSDIIDLLHMLSNYISTNYFDLDICNYEEMEWSKEISELSRVDFQFVKCMCSYLFMRILSRKPIINFYLTNKNEKSFKILKKAYSLAINLASKPSPLRKHINTKDYQSISYRLLGGFYQMNGENDIDLVKKYAHLFLENNGAVDLKENLNKNEKRILFRALKRQPCGQNLTERFTVKLNNNCTSIKSQPFTFNDRRRKVSDYSFRNPTQFLQTHIPAEEYDNNDHNNVAEAIQETNVVTNPETEIHLAEGDQRLMDEFVFQTGSKHKNTYSCPICGLVSKSQVQSLFSHLSIRHPRNCRKIFQHHASHIIKADGTVSEDLCRSTFYCPSITSSGYVICDDYLNTKIANKPIVSSEDFTSFLNEGYTWNILIGWSGTLATEHYYYQKISELGLSDDMRPKLDQTKILGYHIHQEINYSMMTLDLTTDENILTDEALLEEIPFVCQLNCSAIIKAFVRLNYSSLVAMSRKLLIKLAKLIFLQSTRHDAVSMTKHFFLTDAIFVINIIRLFEGGKIQLPKSRNEISNNMRLIRFNNYDFLLVLLLGLESSLDNIDNVRKFISLYMINLENLLASNEHFFILNNEFEASILIRPSILLIQMLFDSVTKFLFSTDFSQYLQDEIEQVIELLSFGIISQNTISKVKIWCLHSLIKIFQFIQVPKLQNPLEDINVVDLCEDLRMEDSSVIYLANCNSTVKKLISVIGRKHILTADCEGTMRLWDIDSAVSEQNLKQTFLFCLGDDILRESTSDGDAPQIMEKCLQVAQPLKIDLSNYLVQVGIQKMAVSPSGCYLAESLGIYLNIWSTNGIYSKPYVTSFTSLITDLIFSKQKFSDLHGCSVDLLLVALANGELSLLRVYDNGTITEHPLSSVTDILSSITAVAWDEENNLIFIGYYDGSIVMTNSDLEKIVLETVHNNRIFILLYCPYTTKSGQNFLASSSFDEEKISIWSKDILVCVLTLSASVSCLEWLSRKYISNEKHHIIIVGISTGLIQFWQIDDSGNYIKNLLTFCGHLNSVLKLRVCEDTNLLASGCSNGWVNIWSIKDGTLINTCLGDGSVIGIEWTLHNNLVVGFSCSQYIKVWRCFTNCTLQKSGIRQWAHIRQVIVQSIGTKSIKHLKNFKLFSISLHKILDEQYLEEVKPIKSGFSIVYSQYLQILIHFTLSLNLIPKFIQYYSVEPVDIENCHQSIYLLNESHFICGERFPLIHHLNLNNDPISNYPFDWLITINEAEKLTQYLCFENEIPLQIIPRWWWVCCLGSEEYINQYLHSKWKNKFWSMNKQIELYQWYQNSPKDWIMNYVDSTYIWGRGNKGELGILPSEEGINPTLIKMEGIQQIVCGSGVTMIITCEGRLMACGEGLEVIFNPFMREDSFRIINVPILNDYKVTHVAVSRGLESHIIAITSFGEIFSWGIGSYGKLGHGHTTTLKKPKLIETLRGKGAVMADCGHNHSAVVTSSGEVYTFGLGKNGQLGTNILSDCDTPRLVDFGDAKLKIGLVACGMNNTLALSTDGRSLFAFGNGTFGKLGVGDFEDHATPKLVNLKKKSLLKVACGNSFSIALDSNGEVLTWGHCDFIGIHKSELNDCENTSIHCSVPIVNCFLAGIGVVVDICAGNEVAFAITTNGHLFGWGADNDYLLRTTSTHVYEPEFIFIQKDLHLRQISCGPSHAAVSTHSSNSFRNNIPVGSQLHHNTNIEKSSVNYPTLYSSDLNHFDMTARLIFLLYWNEIVRLTWQFWIPQTNQHYDSSDYELVNSKHNVPTPQIWPIVNSRQYLFSKSNWNWNPFNKFQNDKVRQLLNNELISSIFYRYLNASMTNSRMYDSLVRIDRINKTESVFQQTCFQVLSMDPVDLRLPWRAWKVKLVNEGADDAGGAYDETISQICNELENENITPRVLIPVPNNTTTFLPNPDPKVPVHYFYFFGILMATAIRTKKPVHLNLDPLFWKRMTKSNVTVDDLISLDPVYFRNLLSVDDANNKIGNALEEIYGIDKFTCYTSNLIETEVIYKGSKRSIQDYNLAEFVNSCIYYRLHEFDCAIENIRKSFCSVAPMVLLDLMSWNQMEKLVCGSKSISVDILKSIARYVDTDETDIIISWFWEILESFTKEDMSLFLRFVTGKSCLPSQDSHIPFRLFIYISKQPITHLPQSQTCFNQIRLPRYNSLLDMETRLRIAINQCRSIDMDDYMLQRNADQ